jgi:methyl-accepting chemotaxis protein/ligand-binding sensor domain-containing protein
MTTKKTAVFSGTRQVRRIVALILLCVGFVFGVRIETQAQGLQFKQLTPNEGLSQSNVSAITQDAFGFMWIGTENGLNRYDGYQVKIYRNDRDDPTSIPSNNIRSLFSDRQGHLWIGTSAGLSRYDRATDTFINIPRGTEQPVNRGAGFTGSGVNAFFEDSKGNLWIGTERGLNRLSPDRESFTHFVRDEQNPASISANSVSSIVEDSQGRLWVGTGNGLNLFDPVSESFQVFQNNPDDPNSLPGNYISALAIDGVGNLWIALNENGLCKTSSTQLIPESFTCYRHDPNDPGSLAINMAFRLLVDNEGTLWVGTENGGLDRYDPLTDSFIHHRNDPNDPGSLTNDSIKSLFQDRTGDLWVGTFSGGVNITKKNGDAIRVFRSIPGNTKSLTYNVVKRFDEDAHGYIWITTDGGGFNRFDPRTNEFKRYTVENSGLNRNATIGIDVGRDGYIWIATWAGGLNRFNPRTGSFKAYTTQNSGIDSNNLLSVVEDLDGYIWFGNQNLSRFDPRTERFEIFGGDSVQVGNRGFIPRLQLDRQGNVLVMGAAGLDVIDPRTGFLTTYRTVDNGGPLSGGVNAVAEDTDGTYWLGAGGSLDHLDPLSGTVTRYGAEHGIPGTAVQGVVFDLSGTIWVSTDRGICRFDVKKETCKTYAIADGLQGMEFMQSSYFRSSDGTIYLGGPNGFNVIRPERIKQNQVAPPIVLTDFLLSGESVEIGKGPLSQHVSVTEEIVLSYDQANFTFQFAALDFTAPTQNQYAYKLEGFDEDWIAAGSKREATYTNLDPGEYVFRVRASNNDGVWNDEGISIRVRIRPPFWATWWFRLLVVTVVVWASVSITRSVRLRRLKLEKMNAELQMQIEHVKRSEEEKQRVAAEAAEKDRQATLAIKEQQEYLEKSVEQILREVDKFAEGDLTVRFTAGKNDAIGDLCKGLNKAVGNIRDMVLRVTEAVASTAGASRQIYASTEEVARGAQAQTRQADEVASAVEEMTGTLAESTRHINMAADMARKSGEDAQKGGQVVQESIASMNNIAAVVHESAQTVEKLGHSSQQIGDITQVIDEIADQTNLLALNAAIEAARAGDQGRGFAVVADEVRKLAERTTASTKQIALKIRQVQQETSLAVKSMEQVTNEVEAGKRLVDKAGEALDSIIRNTQHVLDSITQVARASEEQASTSAHISENIEQITGFSKSAAASNLEIARATEELTRLMENLQALVAQFEVERERHDVEEIHYL